MSLFDLVFDVTFHHISDELNAGFSRRPTPSTPTGNSQLSPSNGTCFGQGAASIKTSSPVSSTSSTPPHVASFTQAAIRAEQPSSMDYSGTTYDSPDLLSQALADYEHLSTQNELLVIELGMREQEHLAFRERHVACDEELKQLHEEGERLERELKELGIVEECEVVDKELSVRPSSTEGATDLPAQDTKPVTFDTSPPIQQKRQLRQGQPSVPADPPSSTPIECGPSDKRISLPSMQPPLDGEAFYRCLMFRRTLPEWHLRLLHSHQGVLTRHRPHYPATQEGCSLVWETADSLASRGLMAAFTFAPILRHCDLSRPVVLECEASDFAIPGVLSHHNPGGLLQPIDTVTVHSDHHEPPVLPNVQNLQPSPSSLDVTTIRIRLRVPKSTRVSDGQTGRPQPTDDSPGGK